MSSFLVPTFYSSVDRFYALAKKSIHEKNIFFFLDFLPARCKAQAITDKSGYTVHLSYYDEITIEISNRIRFIGDGYDEVMITKKAIITDGEREFTDKVVKAYAQKPAF